MGKYNNSKVAVNFLWEHQVFFFGTVVLHKIVCALTLWLMTSIESFHRLKITTGVYVFSFCLLSHDNFIDTDGKHKFHLHLDNQLVLMLGSYKQF